MRILFCSDALSPWQPEPIYEAEVLAAQQAELAYALINFEDLVE